MPAKTVYLDSDIVKLRNAVPDAQGKHALVATLFWGDRVTVVGKQGGQHVVKLARREWDDTKKAYDQVIYQCLLPEKVTFREKPLLKFRVVDVGQGDGAIVESPAGALVLIDGGEESHLRRYLNASFSHVLKTKPIACAAIVVSHGDADHYKGLTDLAAAQRSATSADPMITAERVYHNGIAKGSTSLGATKKANGHTYLTELHDDIRDVPDAKLNGPFQKWKAALLALRTASGKKPKMRRLAWGDDDAFDFLAAEGITVNVLGPIVETVSGKDALPWLGDVSHTINGHSVVLKLTYGNVRFLFGADLNIPSEESLVRKAKAENVSLTAEVLKVPHHGSAEFSPRMLEAVKPVVSIVSSGDENRSKEYIHPRAGLVGALGKFSRGTVDRPLVYVTEMVAFFQRKGKSFRLYEKITFGIVHVRTDGERVLVVTNSGKDDQKEAYAFHVDALGDVTFEEKVKPI